MKIVVASASQPARQTLHTGTALRRSDDILMGAVAAMADVIADRGPRVQLAYRKALLRMVVDNTAPGQLCRPRLDRLGTSRNPAGTALLATTERAAASEKP